MDFLLREFQVLRHLHLPSLGKLGVRAPTELERPSRLFPHMIHLFMLEAGLTHPEVPSLLPWQLLLDLKLRDMLDLGQRLREWIKVLETMLVGVIDREGGPFHLQVEVDEAC